MKFFYLVLLSIILLSCGPSKIYSSSYEAESPYKKSSTFDKGKYEQFLSKEEKEIRSWFHYVVSADTSDNYIVRTFYPETLTMTSKVSYSSEKTIARNGNATEWYDDGSKMYQGHYLNDEAHGIWIRYYYGTDVVSDSGRYENGEKQGAWQSFDNEGRLVSEYEYINNEREGYFTEFDTLGEIVNKGVCRSDTIFEQSNVPTQVFDEVNPAFSICKEGEDPIENKCGKYGMSFFIRENFEYPDFAREMYIQGTAYIQFVISDEGKVIEVNVIRGICDAVKKECQRLIESMPNWEQPGMQAGTPVNVKYTIPIKLRLG